MSSVPNDLTELQARAIIEPWYSMFNQPVRGDIAALHDKAVTPDYQSFTGEGAGESWGRDVSIKVIGSFALSIPDMKFEIKEVLVAGNRVIVSWRSERHARRRSIRRLDSSYRQELQDHGA
jgi:hypothetical protein